MMNSFWAERLIKWQVSFERNDRTKSEEEDHQVAPGEDLPSPSGEGNLKIYMKSCAFSRRNIYGYLKLMIIVMIIAV